MKSPLLWNTNISILQNMAKHLLIKKVRKGKEREWELYFTVTTRIFGVRGSAVG